MIHTVFKNLEASSMTREGIESRFSKWLDKFPDLKSHKVTVTLEMENSRHKPGADLFKARVVIAGKKYGKLSLVKDSSDLHAAIAAVDDGMLELLNRAGDKARVRSRAAARRLERA